MPPAPQKKKKARIKMIEIPTTDGFGIISPSPPLEGAREWRQKSR
jgi:hypothetical protein